MEVTVKSETLTDRSKVYNVVVRDGSESITLNADSQESAEHLADYINARVVGFSAESRCNAYPRLVEALQVVARVAPDTAYIYRALLRELGEIK